MKKERNSGKTPKRTLALLIGAISSATVLAAEPGAGIIGNTMTRPEPMPAVTQPNLNMELPAARRMPDGSEATVVVERIVAEEVEGKGAAARQEKVNAITADYIGRPVTFDALQEMSERITDYYRREGYLLAQAYLPPEALQGGVLSVRIVPGRYDKPAVQTQGKVDAALVERLANGQLVQGQIVHRVELERLSMLLNDVPGMTALVTMKPGTQSGTSLVDVTASQTERIGGYVGADNQGMSATGRWRVLAGGYANDLLGRGDQLRLDVVGSAVGGDGAFAGALDYSALIGSDGWRLGGILARLNYQYELSGGRYTGDATTALLYLNYPLLRRANAVVDLRLDAGVDSLSDRYPELMSALLDGPANKDIARGVLTLRGSAALVAGGLSSFSAQLTYGDINYRNDSSSFVNYADLAGTRGAFARLNYLLSHEQSVSPQWSVYGGVNGQYANKNLDGSQKMLMGGPYTVRAYDAGTGAVAQATVLTAEVRWKTSLLQADDQLTVAAFYDQGWGRQMSDNSSPTGGVLVKDNAVNFAGAGLYAKLTRAKDYALGLTWAHRTGQADPVAENGSKDRLWLTAGKSF